MKVLVPNTVDFAPDLLADCEVVFVDPHAPIPPQHADAEVLVVWDTSTEHLASAAATLTRLRFIQTLSAGVDAVVQAGFRSGIELANGEGLHNRPVTEHAVALVLALLRRLPEARDAQARHVWSRELGGPQPLHPRDRVTTLLGSEVLIWGYGSIARSLAPVLRALGAHVTGVAHAAAYDADNGVPIVPVADVGSRLPTTDVLIAILPATDETRAVVDKRVFDALPARAYFVNVGRGATVASDDLRAALVTHSIAGAALDVTDPEPLPAADELWDAPDLIVTPHAAGGRPVGAGERIAHNVGRLLAGDVDGIIGRRRLG